MSIEEKIEEFEHVFNPLHFYCRLKEMDIQTREAKRWAEIYELGVYKNIIEILKPSYRWSKSQKPKSI